MAVNGTKNYKLSQWEANDRVLREDFNADNATIDAALWGLTQETARLGVEKADASALTAEVQTRASAVSGLNAQVAKLGNCAIYHTSYVGDGTMTRTLTFPKKPLVVFIMGHAVFMWAAPGVDVAMGSSGSESTTCATQWTENSMSWTFSGASYNFTMACNSGNQTYQVVALIDAAA